MFFPGRAGEQSLKVEGCGFRLVEIGGNEWAQTALPLFLCFETTVEPLPGCRT